MLSPFSPYRKAFFFLLDGARADVFADLLARGDLPNISRHVAERGIASTATTSFPSVTISAYTPLLCGQFPGRANIPGLRWFDRRAYAQSPFSLRRFRVYLGLEA